MKSMGKDFMEMKLLGNIKVRLVGVIIAYMLMGGVLFINGYQTIDIDVPTIDNDSLKIELTSQNQISQRILGDDHFLKKMEFKISEAEFSDNARLNVFLTEGSYDLSNTIIKDQQVIMPDDLKNDSSIEVEFSKKKLLYNRDYYIVFMLEDSTGMSKISFLGTDDNSEVLVDGKRIGADLAYSAQYFSWNSRLMFLWKMFFLFGTLALFFCIWKSINFMEAMGIVSLFSALVMYLFGLFDALKWGYYALVLCAGGMFFYVLYRLIKTPAETVKGIWTTKVGWGIVAWLIMIALFLIVDSGYHVHMWDELTHWGLAGKSMYMFDKFPVHPESQIRLYRYPPLSPTIQYLFLQLYGSFSPGIMMFAKHFFESTILLACISRYEKGNYFKPIFVTGLLLLCNGIPTIFANEWYYRLYVDTIVGIVFGYVLIQFLEVKTKRTGDHIILLLMSVATLTLIKENGLIMILVMLAGSMTISILFWLKKKVLKEELRKFSIKYWTAEVVTLAGIILAEISWKLYLRIHLTEFSVSSVAAATVAGVKTVVPEVPGKFAVSIGGNFSVNSIIDFILGRGEIYQYQIIPLHLKYLLFANYYDANIFLLTFSTALFLLVIGLVCAGWFIRKKCSYFNREIKYILIMAVWVCIAFHILYTFVFPAREAVTFASEQRYLGSFLIGISIYIICLILNDAKIIRPLSNYCMCSICVIMVIMTGFGSLYKTTVMSEITVEGEERALNLRHAVLENDRIFWMSTEGNGNNGYAFKYNLAPVFMNNITAGEFTHRFRPTPDAPGDHEYQVSVDEWRAMLAEYDYLYIDFFDDKFIEDYGILFDHADMIESGGLYKIVPEDEKPLKYYMDVN